MSAAEVQGDRMRGGVGWLEASTKCRGASRNRAACQGARRSPAAHDMGRTSDVMDRRRREASGGGDIRL